MTFEEFMTVVIGINPLSIVKLLMVIGLIFYVIFSLVIVRQIQLMANVVEGITPSAIRLITVTHALAAIIVLISAILIL